MHIDGVWEVGKMAMLLSSDLYSIFTVLLSSTIALKIVIFGLVSFRLLVLELYGIKK